MPGSTTQLPCSVYPLRLMSKCLEVNRIVEMDAFAMQISINGGRFWNGSLTFPSNVVRLVCSISFEHCKAGRIKDVGIGLMVSISWFDNILNELLAILPLIIRS